MTPVYNLARAKEADSRVVFLVEGVPDVLRLAEAGYPAVALLGSEPREAQMAKLGRIEGRILAAFDNDPAGQGAWKDFRRMAPAYGLDFDRFPVPTEFKDIGEMRAETLRRTIWRYLRD